MTPFTKQSELAHEARELTVRMVGTVENWKLVLSGLVQSINDESWCDFSEVLEKLQEASEAMDELRAHSDEEIADFCRERMQDDRRAA